MIIGSVWCLVRHCKSTVSGKKAYCSHISHYHCNVSFDVTSGQKKNMHPVNKERDALTLNKAWWDLQR